MHASALHPRDLGKDPSGFMGRDGDKVRVARVFCYFFGCVRERGFIIIGEVLRGRFAGGVFEFWLEVV